MVKRCEFTSRVAPIQPDTREFTAGEEVCLDSISVKGKRPSRGKYIKKFHIPGWYVIEADGLTVPTPHYNVGKILDSEEQARIVSEHANLSPDTERIIKSMIGKSRRKKNRRKKTRRHPSVFSD
jgi:hypothetical protein